MKPKEFDRMVQAYKRDSVLRVSVNLGLTIPVGPYQIVKSTIEVRDILVNEPIEPQIEACLSASEKIWAAIDDEIEVRMMDLVAENEKAILVRDRLTSLEQRFDELEREQDVHGKGKDLETVQS